MQAHLTIYQNDQIVKSQFVRGKFTLGPNLRCDFTHDFDSQARSFALIKKKGTSLYLCLPEGIKGLVKYKDIKVALGDLIGLGIIARQGKFHLFELKVRQRIEFVFEDLRFLIDVPPKGPKVKEVELPRSFKAKPFFLRDLKFTGLVILLLAIDLWFGFYLRSLVYPPIVRPDYREMTKRYATLILEVPKVKPKPKARVTREEKEEKEEEQAKEKEKKAEKKVAKKTTTKAPKKGLVGLLEQEQKRGGLEKAVSMAELQDVFANLGDLVTSDYAESSAVQTARIGSVKPGQITEFVQIVEEAVPEAELREAKITKQQSPFQVTGLGTKYVERSPQVIGRIILSYLNGIKYIYNKALRTDPTLSGEVYIRFDIQPNGTVTGAQILSSSMRNQKFEQTLVSRISHWRFDQVEEAAGLVTVTYRFEFLPAG